MEGKGGAGAAIFWGRWKVEGRREIAKSVGEKGGKATGRQAGGRAEAAWLAERTGDGGKGQGGLGEEEAGFFRFGSDGAPFRGGARMAELPEI
jgi:hypothetical protein